MGIIVHVIVIVILVKSGNCMSLNVEPNKLKHVKSRAQTMIQTYVTTHTENMLIMYSEKDDVVGHDKLKQQ